MRLDVCSSAAVGSIDIVDAKCKESHLIRASECVQPVSAKLGDVQIDPWMQI
jgi:hypothetical protein